MTDTQMIRLRPTLPVLADELRRAGTECTCLCGDPDRAFSGVRLWGPGMEADSEILYVAGQEAFPPAGCAVASQALPQGADAALHCPGQRPEVLLNLLLEIFFRFREQESRIDQLVCRGGSLQELCALGEALLDNPVCIHDDWFIVTAVSPGMETYMAPEHISTSTAGFVPRMIMEDFLHDRDYQETYEHRDAQLWYNNDGTPGSIYVNLWDGTIYRGRLLVVRQARDFRPGDYLLAQVLTQRAAILRQRKPLGQLQTLHSMDDLIAGLLRGQIPEPAELSQLLNLLGWNHGDSFLCIRIRSQLSQPDTLMAHMLHSDLFRVFPQAYILFAEREQCMILNLRREQGSIAALRSRLAPLCRDYFMYAGMSSPVADIRDLHLADHQAAVALETAFRLRGEKWIIPFSDCAMEYLLEKLDSPLPPMGLVSPELLAVLDHDKARGTQYFQTLRAYLLSERDIPRTAQKLIIHRTTLLYRLKKILPMVGGSLEDPWKRLYLILSLWILEREGMA